METKLLSEVSQAPPYYGSHNEGTSPPTPPVEYTNLAHTLVINRQAGPHPERLECPSCRTSIITRVHAVANSKTHLTAAILCMLGGICCCCCIPYCFDSCQIVNHYCPNCDAFIGSYGS